ncbi:MAG: aldo/keto reductase, partial [Candidatus Peregrinibacteria bacterium]|nr:aldo/keto reductase [Candidatus Peregrinibacteria bacterium]
RLQTDYIDLYQLHWPDRNVNTFGDRNFIAEENEQMTPIEETLEALQELKKEGKVRDFGISNESPWGTMEFLRLAKEKNLPRAVTVQNNYSLLTRTFETSMAEVSFRENIGLLAYSPLGYGVLGGRYLDGNKPEIGRLTKYPDFVPRYRIPQVENIIKKYAKLAKENNMSVAQLALAFVYSQSFLTSCIIGPSNVEQLIEDTEAADINLSPEVLQKIEEIHEECPNICA